MHVNSCPIRSSIFFLEFPINEATSYGGTPIGNLMRCCHHGPRNRRLPSAHADKVSMFTKNQRENQKWVTRITYYISWCHININLLIICTHKTELNKKDHKNRRRSLPPTQHHGRPSRAWWTATWDVRPSTSVGTQGLMLLPMGKGWSGESYVGKTMLYTSHLGMVTIPRIYKCISGDLGNGLCRSTSGFEKANHWINHGSWGYIAFKQTIQWGNLIPMVSTMMGSLKSHAQ